MCTMWPCVFLNGLAAPGAAEISLWQFALLKMTIRVAVLISKFMKLILRSEQPELGEWKAVQSGQRGQSLKKHWSASFCFSLSDAISNTKLVDLQWLKEQRGKRQGGLLKWDNILSGSKQHYCYLLTRVTLKRQHRISPKWRHQRNVRKL